jgi:hypothetical protein
MMVVSVDGAEERQKSDKSLKLHGRKALQLKHKNE